MFGRHRVAGGADLFGIRRAGLDIGVLRHGPGRDEQRRSNHEYSFHAQHLMCWVV
jgi:hypothetical protein